MSEVWTQGRYKEVEFPQIRGGITLVLKKIRPQKWMEIFGTVFPQFPETEKPKESEPAPKPVKMTPADVAAKLLWAEKLVRAGYAVAVGDPTPEFCDDDIDGMDMDELNILSAAVIEFNGHADAGSLSRFRERQAAVSAAGSDGK